MGLVSQDFTNSVLQEAVALEAVPDPLLQDKDYLLSTMLEHTGIRIYFKDLQSRFVLINAAQAACLGVDSPAQAIGMSDEDFFCDEHAQQAYSDEQQIIKSGASVLEKEERETWPDGRMTWVATTKMPLRSPEGRIIGTFGVSRDVTEGRRIQEALLESEFRFEELVGAIREVFWIIEAGLKKVLYVSPAYETIWGRRCESLYADPDEWLSAVQDADRQRLYALYAGGTRDPFEATFRIRHPDGILRWIRHRGFPVFGADNQVVRLAGISADITDARLANQALTRNQRLLASILNSSQDAIFSESLDGTITTWNPAAERVFGYAAEEIIGVSGGVLFDASQNREREWILDQTLRGIAVKSLDTKRRHKEGRLIPVALTAFAIRDEAGNMIGFSTIAHDRSARKELEERLSTVESQLRVVLETTGEHVMVLDSEWRLTYINRPRPEDETNSILGTTLWDYDAELVGTIFEQEYRRAMAERVTRRFEGYLTRSKKWLSCTAYPAGAGLLVLAQDITEKRAMDDQLRSAQKMEAIGQLAAGIAHEINTPIQYVGDNTVFLKESWEQVWDILELTQRMLKETTSGRRDTSTPGELGACIQAADLQYLRQEVPRAIDQALDGIGRVASIVRAMKEFSHPGSEEKRAVDLNKAVEATVTISRNEWKYVADIDLHLDPGLPMVVCIAGEINQVLLNLLVNAAHAIAEAQQRDAKKRGEITISTLHEGNWAEIRIRDSGAGIPVAVRDRIFDPFFTTKEVGKGTGQGLTLAQTVVVKKHSGRIWFETDPGQGTTFFVRLPISGASEG